MYFPGMKSYEIYLLTWKQKKRNFHSNTENDLIYVSVLSLRHISDVTLLMSELMQQYLE